MTDTVTFVSLDKLKAPKIQLRPVRKTSVQYHELLDSIKVDGLLQPILARPRHDEEGAYEVVEGNWRRAACIDAGLSKVPCLIKDLSNDQVALIQLKTNAIRPETTRSEYAARLKKLMDDNHYTIPQMVRLINKDANWIRRILRLNRLSNDVKKMVDRGEISIVNAYELVKLPPKLREKFVPQAVVLPCKDFKEMVRASLKDWREFCQRDKIGWIEYKSDNVVGFLRTMKEFNAEVKTRMAADRVLKRMDAKTPLDGWKACLAWMLHLDPESAEKQEFAKEGHRGKAFRLKELRKQNRIYLKELRESENKDG